METITLDTLLQMGQTPILGLIAYLMFKLSQQFTALSAKIETILELTVKDRKDNV